MLHARVTSLPPHVQAVFIQNAMKLFARAVTDAEQSQDDERTENLLNVLTEKLPVFVQSGNLEVQERVSRWIMAVAGVVCDKVTSTCTFEIAQVDFK